MLRNASKDNPALTQVSEPMARRLSRTWLQRWRTSIFWKFVLAMFLASWLGTLIVSSASIALANAKLRTQMSASAMQDRLRTEFASSTPLLAQHLLPPALCEAVLQTIAERMVGGNTDGPDANDFQNAIRDGRFSLAVKSPAGPNCRYPSGGVTPELVQAMNAAIANYRDPALSAHEEARPEGWISAAAISPAGAPGTIVVSGFYGVSSLLHSAFPWVFIGSHILMMNLLSAVALVFLIVRRINHAERAATAWTEGQLQIRINDTHKDEFARLSNRFDVMADAMAEVIKVKQSLAAAEERNRLARDLHDTAKQRAFAVGLQLSTVRNMTDADAATTPLLNAAISLTTQLQRDLSDTIRRLSAPTIAELGLRSAMLESVSALVVGMPISWTLVLNDADEKVLNEWPDMSSQLLMLTTEAVANILKHAGCTQFWVICKREGEVFSWSIIDNGRGFDAAHAASAGMGLSNMKLRASSMPDGVFSLASLEGDGTSVTVTFRSGMCIEP